jgi:bifunctional DNase/RNase
MDMAEMELIGVQLEMPSNSPMLMLREAGGKGRVLPVIIDVPEAQAIGRGLERIRMARPMTHDLMTDMLRQLGAELKSVTVTELRDRTFYAELLIEIAGAEHRVSSRPSDAIALAVRTDVPIYAAEAVLDEAGQYLDGEPVEEIDGMDDPEELLDDFKAFLDDINPEDFDG